MKLADLRPRAIIYALDEWKHLLLGAENTLTIHCDHKNLTYYKLPQRLTPCQARWWNNLSQYNFNLVHIPGTKLIQADALSCQPDHRQGQEEDELVTMLPMDLFLNLISIDLRNRIAKLTETDGYVATIYSCIKRKAPLLRTALTDWTLSRTEFMYLMISTSVDQLQPKPTNHLQLDTLDTSRRSNFLRSDSIGLVWRP